MVNTMKDNMTYEELVDVYIKQEWEIKSPISIYEYKSKIKTTLSDSFGGNKIKFTKTGSVYTIIVKEDSKEKLVFAYSIKNISNILNQSDDVILNNIKKSNFKSSELTNDESIKNAVLLAREELNNCCYVMCRLFTIQENIISDTLSYAFIQNKNKDVSLESISCKTENNEIILVCSEEFEKLFIDKDMANYVKNLILSSISFILEENA